MDNRTILERMIEAKKSHDIVYVCFYNDGKVRKVDNTELLKVKDAETFLPYSYIGDMLCDATRICSEDHNINNVNMDIRLGLVYNASDVDEKNKVIGNAQPLNGIVRYYVSDVNCYLDDKKANYNHRFFCEPGREGYVGYDMLISEMGNSGLSFNGPTTFKEFKEAIASGEKFDISIYADLREKESTKEKPKSFVKSLFK